MYDELMQYIARAEMFGEIEARLLWDQKAMAPPEARERIDVDLIFLSQLAHEAYTSPRVGQLLDQIDEGSLTEDERVNVSEVRRAYEREARIPPELMVEQAKILNSARESRQRAELLRDPREYLHDLARVVEIQRHIALRINEHADPYETMLRGYEPSLTLDTICDLMTQITDVSLPLLQKIAHKPTPHHSWLHHRISNDKLLAYIRSMLRRLGYNFDLGRVDLGSSSCCTVDGRILVRAKEGWWPAISYALHELGHALYEQSRSVKHRHTTLGGSGTPGMHEAIARFFQNHIGGSSSFLRGEFIRLREAFPGVLRDSSPEEFYLAINAVMPGDGRLRGDELSYGLHGAHVLMIEHRLISGDIKAHELPDAWDKGIQDMFGADQIGGRHEYLKDPHWADGAFGYLPLYTYADVIASQLNAAMESELPHAPRMLLASNTEPVREWLSRRIFRHGRRYDTVELVRRATGRPPDASSHVRYLTRKFGQMYDIE